MNYRFALRWMYTDRNVLSWYNLYTFLVSKPDGFNTAAHSHTRLGDLWIEVNHWASLWLAGAVQVVSFVSSVSLYQLDIYNIFSSYCNKIFFAELFTFVIRPLMITVLK